MKRLASALDTLRWLFLGRARPPGMIGRAVAFASGSGAPELTWHRGAWTYHPSDRDPAGVDEDAIFKLVAEGAFVPQVVHVEPDIADQLFQKAVEEAEFSVGQLERSSIAVRDLRAAAEGPELLPSFVEASAALDKALRASMSATVLAIAAAEAQVNKWVEGLGGWNEREDWEAVPVKCQLLSRRCRGDLSLGEDPLQGLQKAIDWRHAFVHPKPAALRLRATGDGAQVPGRTASEEARRAC